MGNTQTKIKEVVTATANAPPAVSISVEVVMLICIITTVTVVSKAIRKYIKKQINRYAVKAGVNNIV